MKKIGLTVVAAMVFVGFASAKTATWNKNDSTDRVWGDKSFWLVDGEAATEIPTNGVDVVFPHLTGYHQRVTTGATASTITGAYWLDLLSVVGDTSHFIANGLNWTSGASNYRIPATVRDPNEFFGFWYAAMPHQRWIFPATSDFTPIVRNVDIQARPYLEFPGEGTAKVEAAFSPGAFMKTGAAELEFGGSLGSGTHIYVEEGGVTFAGHAADETVENVMAKAYMHLDASDESAFEFCAGSETLVTNWFDVRGKSYPCAHVPLKGELVSGTDRVPEAHAPFLTGETSPTGLRLLDFGSCCNEGETPLYGPTGCLMRFPRITNGSEVFAVVRYHDQTTASRGNAILGDTALAPMQPYGGTVFGGSANESFRTGHIYRNGYALRTSDAMTDDYTNLYVVSFGSATDLTVTSIASDQDKSARAGGLVFGELLVFTNALTGADRLRVNDYLMKKWLKGDLGVRSADAGAVVLKGSAGTTSVGVAAGKTARVVDLVSESGTIVKTGAGTLVADAVFPTNAVLDIRAGSVRIDNTLVGAPSTDAAANPLVWLDATKTSSVKVESGHVTGWSDWRDGVDITAVNLTGQTESERPTVVKGAAPKGQDVVDFGSTSDTNASLVFPWYKGAARVYSGFIVMKQLNQNYSYVPFFGCADMSLDREYAPQGEPHQRILGMLYSAPAAITALWTVNGQPVDPVRYMPEYFASTAPYIVVGFTAKAPIAVDAIALGRSEVNRAGYIRVGEFILYDRPLTYKEHRDTEAYLMDKWLDATHPSVATPAYGYKFAAEDDPVVDTEGSLTVSSIEGGTGNLVKRGAGTATLGSSRGISSLAVEDGEIVVPVKNLVESLMNDALFHFDASDSATYDLDANGQVVTWRDVRNNGLYAWAPEKGWAEHYTSRPIPTEDVVTATGVTRTMLNFKSLTSGAGMFMSQDFSNVREEYGFFKANSGNFVTFGWSNANSLTKPTSNYNDYYRASDTVYSSSACAALRNGDIWINGEQVLWNDPLNALNQALLWSSSHAGVSHINAIQVDRGLPGGAYVGEQIAFDRQLTEEERAYLHQHLMYKWLEVGSEPVWTNLFLNAISVADGAVATFSGKSDILAASLDGAGSVNAQSISDVSALSAAGTELAEGKHMVVSGSVRFADVVTVSLSGSGKVFDVPGDYTILEATGGLENVDLANWSCDTSAFSDLRSYTLKQVGNAIVLRVERKGAVLIVR